MRTSHNAAVFSFLLAYCTVPLMQHKCNIPVPQMQQFLLHLRNGRDIILLEGVVTSMGGFSFGQYLVQLREQKLISQRKLAEAAGVTNSTISRIEADAVKPDPATLEKLAAALQVDKTLLLTKCGYSEIPEEFVIIARKTGELSEEKRAEAYKIFNETIDRFLLEDDDEEE